MLKPAISLVMSICVATSALADDCTYDSGQGPSIVIVGERDALDVDFGDWVERCTLDITAPRPDLGFGSGWVPAWIATCDHFSAQVAFVSPEPDGEQTIIVFDGNVFYRDCDAEGSPRSSNGS
jgi:hypothetical protein